MYDDTAYRWRWAALFVILAAEVMDLLDSLITNVAAPSIRAGLGGSDSLIQWLGAGYALAMAVGLITGGRLGDLYGRRKMFLIGSFGFTVASVLCGLAVSPGTMIASRVLQGLFGAVLIPQGLGIIKEMFPPREVAKAFGAFGPVMGMSTVGGPVLAGWLIDLNLFDAGWRTIFLINLPLGLAAFLGALKFLPDSRSTHASRLDFPGMIIASVASFLLIYPLIQGREHGWPVWTFVSMAASVVIFVFFGWYESRRTDPLVVPALFRKRAFTGGLGAGLAFFSGLVGFSLVLSLYLQIELHYTPLHAGLAALPQAIGTVVGFGIGGATGLAENRGRFMIHIGTLIMMAGVVATGFVLYAAGDGLSAWQFTPTLLVAGIGMGMALMPFFDIVLAGVEQHETGSASGTLSAVQQLGGALGTAVLGTIFFNQVGIAATAAVAAAGLLIAFALAFVLPRKAAHVGVAA
ncbi:DHA2 family efflux MFS transporter permease subunit [Streptosporangiaceae bacterium NEAU-GS5]|nr:DHA2 family efflux MFS transporter permease subunit [Streptosporangiaceae bacterium NEAU-GS5]